MTPPIFSQFSSGGGGRAKGFGMGPMGAAAGAMDLELIAQSQGRNFGSYTLNNPYGLSVSTNWQYS